MFQKWILISSILLSFSLAADDHLFYTVYPDVQAYGTQMITSPASNPIESMQVTTVYLAKNEREAFQVFWRSVGKDHQIKLEVTEFKNDKNETLPIEIFAEEFFFTNIYNDRVAEALVPYNNSYGTVLDGTNMMYYVEFHSSKNQREGNYTGTVKILENGNVVETKVMTAEVWNFTLPDSRYSETAMGLYNSNSGYGGTKAILEYNGVQFKDGDVAEESKPLAKKILKGYHEYLLSHGVNTYEIPRWLIDDDPREAAYAIGDVRRKTFMIPEVFLNSFDGQKFNDKATEMINKYKKIINDNEILKDKAYFYLLDEPDFNNKTKEEKFNSISAYLKTIWPGFHSVVPFCNNFDKTYETVKGKSDIFCPNQVFLPTENNLNKFMGNEWKRRWRYPGDNQLGSFFVIIWNVLAAGVMRRVFFWQQYLIKGTGMLFWNIAYFYKDPWIEKTIPPGQGISNDNGDGFLIYPGKSIGQDPTVPIASLRFKQMVDGLDDFDYLKLAEEFLGKEKANEFALKILYGGNKGDLTKIFSKEGGYTAWTCTDLQSVRTEIGKALSAAKGQHKFGDWKFVVEGNGTHGNLTDDGEVADHLYVKKCTVCGTQEMMLSKRLPEPKDEEKGGNYTVLIVCVSVILVLGLGTGAFFLIKKLRKGKDIEIKKNENGNNSELANIN